MKRANPSLHPTASSRLRRPPAAGELQRLGDLTILGTKMGGAMKPNGALATANIDLVRRAFDAFNRAE